MSTAKAWSLGFDVVLLCLICDLCYVQLVTLATFGLHSRVPQPHVHLTMSLFEGLLLAAFLGGSALLRKLRSAGSDSTALAIFLTSALLIAGCCVMILLAVVIISTGLVHHR